jgi:hypothetical protein
MPRFHDLFPEVASPRNRPSSSWSKRCPFEHRAPRPHHRKRPARFFRTIGSLNSEMAAALETLAQLLYQCPRNNGSRRGATLLTTLILGFGTTVKLFPSSREIWLFG